MDPAGWLQTIAEVAIAIAGFSAVITAFRRGHAGLDPMMANRLFSIVTISMVVAFFTILPSVLSGLGIRVATAFRVSALLALAIESLIFFVTIRQLRQIPRYEEQVSRVGAVLAYAFIGISVPTAAICASGLFAGREAGLYLLMLTCFLGVAATRFAGFTAVLLAHRLDEQEGGGVGKGL